MPNRVFPENFRIYKRKFFSKIKLVNKCLVWTGIKSSDGYGLINIGRPTYSAHRFAWTLRNGKIPKGLCVLHKCDNPACVKPNHLWLGTQLDNIADRHKKDRDYHSRGELSGMAKLTNRQAREIKKKYKPHKYTRKMLAKEYGVCVGTIKHIIGGKRYVS